MHQFVPMLHRGDAVGRHAQRLQAEFLARGIPSRLYVEKTDPETSGDTQPYDRYPEQSEAGDVLVYQFATASGLAPWLAQRPERLVLNYHNVTPPEYYAPWDNGLARHQLAARIQLSSLATKAALAVAVSAYNEVELHEAGYTRTAVIPPASMLNLPDDPLPRPPCVAGARWVAVGRLAPNKALQHAVTALLVARAHHDPDAMLQLIGRSVVPSYTTALSRFVDELGLHDAVVFRGQLQDAALAEALADADVLVVPSGHEGFGIPVIEAMASGLPVVANAAGALPDIVGDGGVLVDAGDPWSLAQEISRVLSDVALRDTLRAGAQRQLQALDLPSAAARFADIVSTL